MGDDWNPDYSYVASEADAPGEEQLDRLVTFSQDHTKKLAEIESAIHETVGQPWSTVSDPIVMHMQPEERVFVPDLIVTDNELFKKVVTVMAVLCDEAHQLKADAVAHFYPALAVFGRTAVADDGHEKAVPDEERVMHMGRMLKFFQELQNFVDRCNSIVVNAVHQFASLYHRRQRIWETTYKNVHLMSVFRALASILEVLITLDAIVADNHALGMAWDKFKRMMQFARADPAAYGTDEAQLRRFDQLLVRLNESVLAGGMLQSCVEQDFEEGSSAHRVDVRSNTQFLSEFFRCICAMLDRTSNMLNSSSETIERRRVVGTFGLYVLYRRLVPMKQRVDESFYRKLWSIQKQVPLVTLYGKATWFAPEFLRKHVAVPITKLDPKSVPQHRAAVVKALPAQFPPTVARLQLQVSTWMCRFEAVFQVTPRGRITQKDVGEQGRLLHTGILLATKIRNQLATFVNMHIKLEAPMPRSAIHPLCTCIELLKSIEAMYQRKTDVISQCISHVNYAYAQSAGETLRNLYKRVASARSRGDDSKLDLMASAEVALNVLRSGETFSFSRVIVLEIAVDVAMMKGGVKSNQADSLNRMLWNMRLLQDCQMQVRQACDCSFLFWHRELLSPFLKSIYREPVTSTRLQSVISGFSDAAHLLAAQVHDPTDESREAYKAFLTKQLEVEIVNKLCEGIEDVLRERVHAVSLDHMEAPNPQEMMMGSFGSFLELPTLHVFDTTLSLRRRVEHYLDRTFFNLTTVSLHDWQTYSEMRSLAVEMFGLQLTDGHLPMGSLNQGLDVLQIMRNINVFVAKYCYNLNEQLFIERRPQKGSKMANTICIHSIADSIRQHGIGIMNTTVNFTFQFLQHKFHIFSQFLLDQYINAIASRERRWYRKHRDDDEVGNAYPYDHAQTLIKDIRKLSSSRGAKTVSFLDKFRMLITQIGNAVGYVRMVRSAGLNYCSNAIQFVPDLENIIAFEPRAGTGAPAVPAADGGDEPEEEEIEGAGLSSATVAAARTLDKVVNNLSTNFAEGTNYLKVLAKEFAETLAKDDNKHLKNFFVLVTPLILNFSESIRAAKGQLDKVQRGKPAYFTDDGFAMGIAFILAILRQNDAFNSLHFFDSMRRRFKTEEASIKAMTASGSGAELEQRQQEIRFRQTRHKATVREVEMFFFAFDGAKIFFNGMDEK